MPMSVASATAEATNDQNGSKTRFSSKAVSKVRPEPVDPIRHIISTPGSSLAFDIEFSKEVFTNFKLKTLSNHGYFMLKKLD